MGFMTSVEAGEKWNLSKRRVAILCAEGRVPGAEKKANVSPGGRFTAWYEDDDMFWGHVVMVDGTLKKGPIGADMQG